METSEKKLRNISVHTQLIGDRTIVVGEGAFQDACRLALSVAASEANVLIEGESGTGKELIAALIHVNSSRSTRHFVTMNCAALSDTLLETQLFGHVRGAFTGAISDRRGLLDEADGGTLFLDGIADLDIHFQAKLLRVVQEGEFIPVGDTNPRRVSIRFVAAASRPLQEEVAAGRFREDLFYRLNVIPISLPPLHQRKEDILPLAIHFLERYSGQLGKRICDIAPDARKWLEQYHWPGNVRELENVMERAAIIESGPVLTVLALPIHSTSPAPSRSAPQLRLISLDQVEREHIAGVLGATGWHKSRSAEILGISRKTLDRKISDFHLDKTAVPQARRYA